MQASVRPAVKHPEAKLVVDDGKVTEEPEAKSSDDQLAQSSGDARWHQMSPPEKFEDSDLSSFETVTRAAGVSKRTLNRWLKMPEFEAAYREARRAAMFQANARLQQASSAAVSALFKVMVDPGTPASVRVRAADCILSRGMVPGPPPERPVSD